MATSFYDPLFQELYEAGLQLRPFLEASTDPSELTDVTAALAYITKKNAMSEVERLRERAERMEANDAAILRFRKALQAIAERE